MALIAMSTVSAKAVSLPNLGAFSLTAGVASNESVFGASATETNLNDTGGTGHVKEESGVFQAGYSSQFIELGIGEWISLGYEHTPDSITTPKNTDNEGKTGKERNVHVDFDDLNTTYAKINTPWGFYVLAGEVETDLKIKITGGSGSTYDNKSISGDITAAGYQRYLGDSGFGVRVQGSYMEFDNVTTSSGNASTVAAGGNNTIAADNLSGASAKIALTYTLGRNK